MSQTDVTAHPLISVIIPCYNQAKFLGEAIASVLAQSHQDFEVIVVDDGSIDATAEVAGQYPQVRYLKQTNQGLSAARNTGMDISRGRYLVFLDADDRLFPEALNAGLQCMQEHPEAAFISGGYYRIDESGQIIEKPTPAHIVKDHYLALLQGNYVGMHGTVMFQRRHLMACGGYSISLHHCEDYELYLRLARNNTVACHDTVVAEYRIHSTNKSNDAVTMLSKVLKVLQSQHRYLQDDPQRLQAYQAGMSYWKTFYAEQFVNRWSSGATSGNISVISGGVLLMLRYAPKEFLESVYQSKVRPLLPTSLLRLVARLRGYPYYPPAGRTRFGDLRRLQPISAWFGYDRGLPVDRYYIERFLDSSADDIRGRVLEIGDAAYTQRFGGDRVTTSDVLHVEERDPRATFVGDLTSAEHIPTNAFDCAIITQTLHLIYNVRPALATLYRILKPGGVLLATVPGISQISKDQWSKSWYWSFTTLSIQRLLEEVFPSDDISVAAQGNVLAATAFLQGIATDELFSQELDFHDDQYELLITVRAVKPIPQQLS